LAAEFTVYIDESGDDGFKFPATPGAGGSSEWLVLSAVIVRTAAESQIIRMMADLRARLGRRPLEPLHFRNMKHELRIPYVTAIASQPLRVISVLVHKPSLSDPSKFEKPKNRLYFYSVRYLLERVSWFCRDVHRAKAQGDGTARIVFSNRSSMSYDELRNYIGILLNKRPPFGDVRIDPTVVRPQQIEARTHEQMAGLQIADAVASSFFFGVQSHPFGFTEPRYALALSPVLYRHKQCCHAYGLKFWPRECDALLQNRETLAWISQLGK
jgi:hypothetical protein